MTVKPVFNQMELSFWQHIIPMMQNSKLIKTITPPLYQLVSNLWEVKPIIIIYFCFMSGATFYFLFDLLR